MDTEIRKRIWDVEMKLRESGEFREFMEEYYSVDAQLVKAAQTMTEEQTEVLFDYLNMHNRLTEIMLEIAVSQSD